MNDARHTVSNPYTVLVLSVITVEGMRCVVLSQVMSSCHRLPWDLVFVL